MSSVCFRMSKIVDKVLYPLHKGPEVELPDIHGNLGEEILNGFDQVLKKYGDFDWIINGPFDATNQTSSCGVKRRKVSEVEPCARKIAAAFHAHGLSKNEVVHILLPNSTENHTIAIGAWLCQAVVSLSDPGLSLNVLKAQIKDTKAKIIICSYISRKTVSQALLELGLSNKVQVIILEKAQGQDEPISEPGFKFFQDFIHGQKFYSLKSERLRDDDVFVIFWSSGTTGNPKGIQHDVNYARHMIKGYITRGKLSPLFSKYLQTTCYFHIGGFISPLNTMSAPLTFVFNHSQDLDELHSTNDLLLKEIDLYKPYLMICGSHHLVQLSTVVGQISTEKLDLSSVELVMPMGSTIPLTLFEDLKKFLPNLNHVYQIYGMTEIGGTLAWSFNARNLGVVHPDAALKIVDPETGETCGPHQVGEIWAKTSAFMRGYLNNPAETLKFFATNGFAHTGDLGHYDEDGIIFFDGRLKDLIKYKNCHLYPIEIENIICTHPDVIEAGVFGKPDPSVQEYVTALVVKVPNSKVTEQNIIDLVAEQADDAKKLRGGVKFVEKLPKNPQGKIVRRKLIEML